MARVVCSTGFGVTQYVVHANYSTTPDPYPNGATITSYSTKALSNIVNNSSVTVRASETSVGSNYTFPVQVYRSTDGSTWYYVDDLKSGNSVSVAVGGGNETIYLRVGPAKVKPQSATLVCSTGTGVTQYVLHANYTITPDPYPNGATVTTGGKTLAYVEPNSTVTVYANESKLSSGYSTPVNVYKSTDGKSWTYVDYFVTGHASVTVSAGTTYIRVGPATASEYKYRVKVNGGQSQYGGTSETKYYPSQSGWYSTSSASSPYFDLSNVSLTAPTNYALLGFSYNSTGDKIYTDKMQVSSTTSGTETSIYAMWGRYYYRVRYYLNDESGTSAYYPSAGAAFSLTKSPTFYLSNIPTPTRTGYTFKGWAYGSTHTSGEPSYFDTISLDAISTSSDSPTVNNIHAVWDREKSYRVSVYFNGGTYGGDSTWYYPSSSNWQYVTADSVNYPLGNIPQPTKKGYKFLGWARGRDPSSGETVLTQYVTITPTESGTVQYLHAVWEQLKSYRVHAIGNGGTSPNGSTDIWYPSASEYSYSESTTANFDLGLLPSFTKPGYNFVGWAYRATIEPGESYFSPNETMPVDAFIDGATTNIYAVYEARYKYRVVLYGNGGRTSGGATVAYFPSNDGFIFTDRSIVNFQLNLVANTFTNGRKHIIGWAYNSTPTAGEKPINGTIEVDASEIGSVTNIHAIWADEMALFTWYGSDEEDNAKIVAGKPREMTASMWASFANKVEELADAVGVTVSVDRVSSSGRMLASQYNSAVTALALIRLGMSGGSSVSMPSRVSAGGNITAAQFNAQTRSLKGSLNGLIGVYNNGGS